MRGTSSGSKGDKQGQPDRARAAEQVQDPRVLQLAAAVESATERHELPQQARHELRPRDVEPADVLAKHAAHELLLEPRHLPLPRGRPQDPH